MLRVALTGGIGTGKTVVLGAMRDRGVPVIDADSLAHDAIAPGTPGAAAVRVRFGPSVMTETGGVDRGRLGAVVFSDDGARRELEAIIHPAVYAAVRQWMETCAARGAPMAVAEIPLLFETGHEGDFDYVVVTACDPDEQRRRVVGRGASDADARRRIAAQWPLEVKTGRAHFVIRTDGALADTVARTGAVVAALEARAAGR